MLVGIDIGGTKTAVALAEHPDCILYGQEFPTLRRSGTGACARTDPAFDPIWIESSRPSERVPAWRELWWAT